MTASESEPERLEIDTETWSKRDLIQVISSRYFVLGEVESGEYSWRVNGIDGKSESECLLNMNSHLEKLGMIGLLDRGNPPVMSVVELPTGVFVMPRWQQAVIWITMFSFMTIAGTGLLLRNNPELSFGIPLIADSCARFSIPLAVTILLASEARRRVASKYGVSIGQLTPLAFPISEPIWPFGIAGFISQRRSDQVPIPNRKALGLIEVTSPLVLFLSGVIMTILGVSLTSTQPPPLNSPPMVFSGNSILEMLQFLGIIENLDIKLQWLDPLAIAGLGLCTVSWIMLLPVPGFPGDHLLHAIMGPEDLLSDEKQTLIFASTLFFMVLVFSTDPWFPWLVIATIAVWRRFSPTPILDPFVVDESKGLDDISRNQILALMIFILIVAFPGIDGAYGISEWDEGIETSEWPDEVRYSVGEDTIIPLQISPDGVMPVSGWLQFRIEGTETRLVLDSDCNNDSQTCRIDGVTQFENGLINLTISAENSVLLDNRTASIRIFSEISGHYEEHVITIIPDASRYQQRSVWELTGTLQEPVICTYFIIEDESSGNVSVSNPRWSLLNDSAIDQGNNQICLLGVNGASISGASDYLGRHLGPLLTITWDDGNASSWRNPIEKTSPLVNSLEGTLKIPQVFSGHSVGFVESTAPFCPTQTDFPEVDPNIAWNRTLGDYSFIELPDEYTGNGSLVVQEGGWLVVCDSNTMTSSFLISNGPELWVYPGGLRNGSSFSDSSIIRISNLQNETLPIFVSASGPPGELWDIQAPDSISAYSDANITLSITEPGYEAVVWVVPEESRIIVHSDIREYWQ